MNYEEATQTNCSLSHHLIIIFSSSSISHRANRFAQKITIIKMATKIKINNLPIGFQSIISNGRHSILGDEPINSKGTDLGFSPEDLILSALAACKVSTVRFIARKNKWEIGNVEAELEQIVKRGEGGKLSTTVKVAIHIEGNISEEQREELLHQADNCYIHRMIKGDWNIEAAVELAEMA
jgi:putative redox protein